MAKIVTITDNFYVDKDSLNPLFVKAVITAEYEYPEGWTWTVDAITSVECVIGNKESVDITRQVLSSKRMTALIESQIDDMQDEIIEALAEHEPETINQ